MTSWISRLFGAGGVGRGVDVVQLDIKSGLDYFLKRLKESKWVAHGEFFQVLH